MNGDVNAKEGPSGPKPLDFADLIATAVTEHGLATAGIFEKLNTGDPVDVVKEGLACAGRLLSTGAKFLIFWDNFATLLTLDADKPMYHSPPPVGAAGQTATSTVDPAGLLNPTSPSGLRRRGETKMSVVPAKVNVTSSANGFLVRVDVEGVPRGLYEGSFDATDASGNAQKVTYNVYVDLA